MVLSHPLGPFRAIQRVRDRRVTLMLDFSAAEIEAVRLSLRIAFWAMVGSLPFGLATAIVLARGRFYGKSLLDGVVHLPLVMPPVVTGYLLLLLFGLHGPLGRFLDESFGIVCGARPALEFDPAHRGVWHAHVAPSGCAGRHRLAGAHPRA
jgi:ABC-type sulfate transport system permease component